MIIFAKVFFDCIMIGVMILKALKPSFETLLNAPPFAFMVKIGSFTSTSSAKTPSKTAI